MPRPFARLCALASLLAASPLVAGVKTDGTLGPRQSLPGPNFNVLPSYGHQVGANLFHSFDTFSLAAGETATFTGPATVKNVLARVTGGAVSSINGALACSIADADLYLINPAGVIFGADARLQVQGSFAVTTADHLKLTGGGAFAARARPAASTLTSAPPAAFGFLSSRPAADVAFGPAHIAVGGGRRLSVVAGGIRLSGASLSAREGRADLAAAAPGATVVPAASANGPLSTDRRAARGRVQLEAAAIVDVGSGRVAVNGGDVSMLGGSRLDASPRGDRPGRGITVDAGTLTLRAASRIESDAQGRGRAGDLDVRAGTLVMQGANVDRDTGIYSASAPGHGGRGGDVRVTADTVTLRGGAQVATAARGAAPAGDLTVTARRIMIDGAGVPGDRDTGLEARSDERATGPGGRLTVRAASVDVRAGGTITADTSGAGRGGDLSIDARSVTVDGAGEAADAATGISTDTLAESGPAGAGGRLNIRARTLVVRAGGQVSADTVRRGTGGDATIDARTIIVDGSGASDDDSSIISTDALSGHGRSGPGGRLTLRAGAIDLRAGGEITADTYGPGRGGDLNVTARTIVVDATGGAVTDISTDSLGEAGPGGAAGRLTISADAITLRQRGQIAAETFGTGAGGDAVIRARRLSLASGGIISTGTTGPGPGGTLVVDAATLIADATGGPTNRITGLAAQSASSATGDAGNLTVRAASIALRAGAQIAVRTFGAGRGGNLSVAAGSVTIDGTPGTTTGLDASAQPDATGNAGEISVDAADISLTHGGRISADTFGAATGGNIRLRARALSLASGGVITAGTAGRGAGGAMTIDASSLVINGAATPPHQVTGLAVQAGATATGAAGDLIVRAHSIDLRAAGQITAGTFGAGHGGNIDVHARTLMIDAATATAGPITGLAALADHGSTAPAGDLAIRARSITLRHLGAITAQTFGAGPGGNVGVDAGSLTIESGGYVSASTATAAPGGNVALNARHLLIDGTGDGLMATGVFARSNAAAGAGPAGGIAIRAGASAILTHGAIVTTSAAHGSAGDLVLSAGHSILLNDHSSIIATAGNNGGNVAVHAPLVIRLLRGSSVRTRSDAANGGNITIDPLVFRLRSRSFVTANGGKQGGNISVFADATPGLRAAGRPDDNMTATGTTGLAGSINSAPANNNIAAALVPLNATFTVAAALRDVCGLRLGAAASSFLITGRGGTAPEPGGWLLDVE